MFLTAESHIDLWKIMHMWRGEFSMFASTILKTQKISWIFSETWFVCFEYMCTEEEHGNL